MFNASFNRLGSRLGIAIAAGSLVALAGLGGSYIVPLDHQAIQYVKNPVDDAVARIIEGLAREWPLLNYERELQGRQIALL